ncbi:MAG: hypothetical protein V4636_09265 [Pseudomonadota bacterium]
MNSVVSVQSRVSDALLSVLDSRAAPIDQARLLLKQGEATFVLSGIVCSFSDSQDCVELGAALELIHVGLHRLHVRIDDDRHLPVPLRPAGRVLVGDYLTSGAFRLLSRCRDAQALKAIGIAMVQTCEHEVVALGEDQTAEAVARSYMPLGEAAGLAGAQLAGCRPDALAEASRFGGALFAAHALLRHGLRDTDAIRSTALIAASRRTSQTALENAQALHAMTGLDAPLAFATERHARIDAEASARH